MPQQPSSITYRKAKSKNMIVGLCHFKSCHVINTEKGQQSNEQKTVSISGRKRLSTEETVQINAVRTAGKVQRNRNSADACADGGSSDFKTGEKVISILIAFLLGKLYN